MSLAEVAASGGLSGCHSVDVLWTQRLGRGSFGEVYKGILYPSGLACAVKTAMLSSAGSDSIASSSNVDGAGMLKDEAALMSRLSHKNIVACYGLFEHDNMQCAALEFSDGGDLLAYLGRQQDCLPVAAVRMFMQHVLSGVTYLWGRSIVHLDIKPANLLLSGCQKESAGRTLKLGLCRYSLALGQ